jgi:hypothetical protein
MYTAGYRKNTPTEILTGYIPVQSDVQDIVSNVLFFARQRMAFTVCSDGLLSLGKYKWTD